jgi:predicted DCC family thiol-disulfide oxidoreductase YuxK
MTHSGPILLFDGVCNLCNRLVMFIIRKDTKAKIRFAALQSGAGKSLLEAYCLSENDLDSVVYITDQALFLKSRAILHLLKDIGGIWRAFYIFIIIPRFILDFLYDIIAKNRYRIFGRKEICMTPSPDFVNRFIL